MLEVRAIRYVPRGWPAAWNINVASGVDIDGPKFKDCLDWKGKGKDGEGKKWWDRAKLQVYGTATLLPR